MLFTLLLCSLLLFGGWCLLFGGCRFACSVAQRLQQATLQAKVSRQTADVSKEGK
jgi:hypothetical protein